MRSCFSKFALLLSSLVLIAGTLELTAYAFDSIWPMPPDHAANLRDLPAPYADASYATAEFGAEAMAMAGQTEPEDDETFSIPTFSGRYFNVADGIRATTGQPQVYSNSVHVFGGSTVFCAEVPDSLTLTSFLQRLLTARFGARFIVYNRGVPGLTATAQTTLLRTVHVREGDIVVYYDGTNEVSDSIYYGSGDPLIEERMSVSRDSWSLLDRATFLVWRFAHPYSAFVRRFCDVERRARWMRPPHLDNSDEMDGLLLRMRSSYQTAIREAHEFAAAKGARFVHFLQPTLFTLKHWTAYEEELANNPNMVFRGMGSAHEFGYPALRQALRELDGEVLSYDLSSVFDTRPEGEEYFLDDCHVTEKANAVVAQKFFEILVELIGEAG